MEQLVSIILNVVGLYLIIGLVFSLVFYRKGLGKVDQATQGASLIFRIIILPGMLVFWPHFLIKWIKLK